MILVIKQLFPLKLFNNHKHTWQLWFWKKYGGFFWPPLCKLCRKLAWRVPSWGFFLAMKLFKVLVQRLLEDDSQHVLVDLLCCICFSNYSNITSDTMSMCQQHIVTLICFILSMFWTVILLLKMIYSYLV